MNKFRKTTEQLTHTCLSLSFSCSACMQKSNFSKVFEPMVSKDKILYNHLHVCFYFSSIDKGMGEGNEIGGTQ